MKNNWLKRNWPYLFFILLWIIADLVLLGLGFYNAALLLFVGAFLETGVAVSIWITPKSLVTLSKGKTILWSLLKPFSLLFSVVAPSLICYLCYYKAGKMTTADVVVLFVPLLLSMLDEGLFIIQTFRDSKKS